MELFFAENVKFVACLRESDEARRALCARLMRYAKLIRRNLFAGKGVMAGFGTGRQVLCRQGWKVQI